MFIPDWDWIPEVTIALKFYDFWGDFITKIFWLGIEWVTNSFLRSFNSPLPYPLFWKYIISVNSSFSTCVQRTMLFDFCYVVCKYVVTHFCCDFIVKFVSSANVFGLGKPNSFLLKFDQSTDPLCKETSEYLSSDTNMFPHLSIFIPKSFELHISLAVSNELTCPQYKQSMSLLFSRKMCHKR